MSVLQDMQTKCDTHYKWQTEQKNISDLLQMRAYYLCIAIAAIKVKTLLIKDRALGIGKKDESYLEMLRFLLTKLIDHSIDVAKDTQNKVKSQSFHQIQAVHELINEDIHLLEAWKKEVYQLTPELKNINMAEVAKSIGEATVTAYNIPKIFTKSVLTIIHQIHKDEKQRDIDQAFVLEVANWVKEIQKAASYFELDSSKSKTILNYLDEYDVKRKRLDAKVEEGKLKMLTVKNHLFHYWTFDSVTFTESFDKLYNGLVNYFKTQ